MHPVSADSNQGQDFWSLNWIGFSEVYLLGPSHEVTQINFIIVKFGHLGDISWCHRRTLPWL